jgi:DNA replication initiation complex subunit (GINS family)
LAEGTLETLQRQLELEEQSEKLSFLDQEAYIAVARYAQGLQRLAGASSSEVTNRLVARQAGLLSRMTSKLLTMRIAKAARLKAVQHLLPEERYVCSKQEQFHRRKDAFLQAISEGHSSFLTTARANELSKSVTVRFLKPIKEIMGYDLKRYGPYQAEDIGVVPSANVDVLVANGEAVVVFSRDSL